MEELAVVLFSVNFLCLVAAVLVVNEFGALTDYYQSSLAQCTPEIWCIWQLMKEAFHCSIISFTQLNSPLKSRSSKLGKNPLQWPIGVRMFEE